MEPCIFCAILAEHSPGSIFYTDDHVVGLLDINPVTEGTP
jgi:diadenosine tetraphosphate (Ap4A) HIT family hydrolase